MTDPFVPAADAVAQGADLHAFCQALPKVELHCHLLGAIREATFRELAQRQGGITPEQITGLYAHGEKRQGAIPALRALEQHILRHPDDLYRLTREYLEDAHAHHVLYTEFFWNPTGVVKHSGLPYRVLQDAIVRAVNDARQDLGIISRLIPSIDREASPGEAEEMVAWMVAARCDEVPGIGMDYREALGPPEHFVAAYAAARRAGLRTTVHAGEYGMPWKNVQTAVDALGVDRIDHGYTIIDRPELVQRCVERAMVFAIVPANSYYLRTLPPERWALDHPIRRMLALGLKVHPNSDDPALHNISPTRAWCMMVEQFGCRIDDLRTLMLNGLDGAWMDDELRARWRTDWNARFDALKAQYFPAATSV